MDGALHVPGAPLADGVDNFQVFDVQVEHLRVYDRVTLINIRALAALNGSGLLVLALLAAVLAGTLLATLIIVLGLLVLASDLLHAIGSIHSHLSAIVAHESCIGVGAGVVALQIFIAGVGLALVCLLQLIRLREDMVLRGGGILCQRALKLHGVGFGGRLLSKGDLKSLVVFFEFLAIELVYQHQKAFLVRFLVLDAHIALYGGEILRLFVLHSGLVFICLICCSGKMR